MPLSLKRGTVTAVVERLERLDRIEVDGEPIAVDRAKPTVATARDLTRELQTRVDALR